MLPFIEADTAKDDPNGTLGPPPYRNACQNMCSWLVDSTNSRTCLFETVVSYPAVTGKITNNDNANGRINQGQTECHAKAGQWEERIANISTGYLDKRRGQMK